MDYKNLKQSDEEVYKCVLAEQNRQAKELEMIASENYVSPAVM